MTTAIDIITDAVEQIGVQSPGDVLSGTDAERSLIVLNNMISEWAAQNLFVFQVVSTSVSLSTGVAMYAVGRPWAVSYGPGMATLNPGGPVNVVSAVEFRALAANAPVPGPPSVAWYALTYPVGTVTVLPTPDTAYTLTLPVWGPLNSFPDLYTDFAMPPGQAECLRDNLSVELKPYFSDAMVSPTVAQGALLSKQFLALHGLASRAMLDRMSVTPASAGARR